MNMFLCSKFLLIVFLYYANGVILDTKQGTLKGETLVSRDGRPFYAFYNIPYAEPPIGQLRFEVSYENFKFFNNIRWSENQ